MNTPRATLTTCKDVAIAIFDKVQGMDNPEYKVVGVYYEAFPMINDNHIAVLVVGDYKKFADDTDLFLNSHCIMGSMQVEVDVKYMHVEGNCASTIAAKLYAVRNLSKQLVGIDHFNRALITDSKLAFTNCIEVTKSGFDSVYEPIESKDGLDTVVVPPIMHITIPSPVRHSFGMVEATNPECGSMYQHFINVKPHAVGDVSNSLQAAILKHMNMHSLPKYGDLSSEFQDMLGMYGITPIEVENGVVRWKKDVLDTGITFADELQRITDGGNETRYVLSVMHMHIDGRNLAVCISKRYMGKRTTPSYLLNVIELLSDEQSMPYDGDILQLITKHLVAV